MALNKCRHTKDRSQLPIFATAILHHMEKYVNNLKKLIFFHNKLPIDLAKGGTLASFPLEVHIPLFFSLFLPICSYFIADKVHMVLILVCIKQKMRVPHLKFHVNVHFIVLFSDRVTWTLPVL